MKLKYYNNGVIMIKPGRDYFDVMGVNFNDQASSMLGYQRLAHVFCNDTEGFSVQFYNYELNSFPKAYYAYLKKMFKDGVFWENIKILLDCNIHNIKKAVMISWNNKGKDAKISGWFYYVFNVMIRNYLSSKCNINLMETIKTLTNGSNGYERAILDFNVEQI